MSEVDEGGGVGENKDGMMSTPQVEMEGPTPLVAEEWRQHIKQYHKLIDTIYEKKKVNESDPETQQYMIEKIMDISGLLCQGTPLTPPSNFSYELLYAAISSESVQILEVLLANNVPWYWTSGTRDILEYTWLDCENSTKQAMLITRKIHMQLLYEKEIISQKEQKGSLLLEGINSLLKKLEPTESTPYRARWKVNNAKTSSQDYNLLVKACEYGATGTAWFMWRSGINTSLADDQGQFPLDTAIKHEHWDTVRHLINYMGCNPFIKTAKDTEPLYQYIPEQYRKEILQNMALKEFNIVNSAIESAKDAEKQEKMKMMMLLFIALYYTFNDEEKKITWKKIFSYTSKLLQSVTEERQGNASDVQNDWVTWGYKLCQKMSTDLRQDDQIDLTVFLNCLDKLSNEKDKFQQMIGEIRPIDKRLIQALEFTCANKCPLFLHMLISHAGIDPKVIKLDEMLNTLALHHAATEGNIVAAAYLIHTCDVNSDDVDRNGNNAAHYAYLNGHINLGKYLGENKPELKLMEMVNSSKKTPLDLKRAFEERVTKLQFKKLDKKLKEELYEKEQVLCEKSNEIELTKHIFDFEMFKKSITKKSFKELTLEKRADYNKGEGSLIFTKICQFIESVGTLISEDNKYLCGKLVPAGSSADDCRLGAPDQSDFNWVIDWKKDVVAKLEEITEPNPVTHQIVLESDNKDIKRLLLGSNLLDDFEESVTKAIKCLEIDDEQLSIVLPGVKRTRVGMALTFAWMGSDHKLLLVDVDLVPVIKTARPANYPSSLTKIRSDTKQLIQHTIKIAGKEWVFSEDDILHNVYLNSIGNGEWRFSQTMEENYIMLTLSTNQKNVFLISKYLLSFLKAEPWHPLKVKKRLQYFISKLFNIPAPKGFLLKSSFFKELERVREDKNWEEQYYLDRIKCIFLHMCGESLTRDNLLESLLAKSKDISPPPKTDITVKEYKLLIGIVPSYFATNTEIPATAFLGPTLFNILNTMKIEDFVADDNKKEREEGHAY